MKVQVTFDDTLYQLVPVNPTEQQQIVAAKRLVGGADDLANMQWGLKWACFVYEAMLSAAPTTPAQPVEQPPIPESLWRSILDAGLTLHKEGDEWWIGKAQPAERKPLTDDQIDSACMWIFGSDYAGVLTLSLQRAVARAIEAAHGIKGES